MSNSSMTVQDDAVNLKALERDDDNLDPVQKSASEMSHEEMRSSPRMKFQATQRIAPMYNRFLPSEDKFFNVECNDISRGGISFYLKRSPGCEYFAIVLGQEPATTILVAQVVNSREVEHDNRQMCLVGCKFIDRPQQ